MSRRFDAIGIGLLLIAVLLAVAWVAREEVVSCEGWSYCVVQNRWTGSLRVVEPQTPDSSTRLERLDKLLETP